MNQHSHARLLSTLKNLASPVCLTLRHKVLNNTLCRRLRPALSLALSTVLLWNFAYVPSAFALNEGAPAVTPDTNTSTSFLEIILSGGVIGFAILVLLVLLSMLTFALTVEHFLSLRRQKLIPEPLRSELQTSLSQLDLHAAHQSCGTSPSFLAFIVSSAIQETEQGWEAVEKTLEDATANQAARLFRKIEYLSVIGNIAPMIGLLGTVIGMIFAFQAVAETQGAARAGQLAEGIYQALVTTVGGLLIAIPALAAYAIFRNRVDQIVAETAYTAQELLRPIKHALLKKRLNAPALSQPSGQPLPGQPLPNQPASPLSPKNHS